jgi:hypothetical protein
MEGSSNSDGVPDEVGSGKGVSQGVFETVFTNAKAGMDGVDKQKVGGVCSVLVGLGWRGSTDQKQKQGVVSIGNSALLVAEK